jgi:hypothetical protein
MFGSSTGRLYCFNRLGTGCGRISPLWQLLHVTTRAPPKCVVLIALTIAIISRARRLRGVSSANFSRLFRLLSTWQCTQFAPSAAEMNPIVSQNSPTGIPRSCWTFLKTSSAMTCFGAAVAARPLVA